MAKSKGELSPLMKQYWDIKAAHKDKILMFRMGDFFEMFYEDAQTAAPILGIALTARNKKSGDQTPMCGMPHHSVGNHINKLLAQGYKVAICDQVEDAKQAKGLVKRAVTRILSPGMVFDPDTLEADEFNYLCSFDSDSVSFLESTTGECFYYSVKNAAEQVKLIRTLNPVEIVTTETHLARIKTALGEDYVYTAHEELHGVEKRESIRRLLAYAIHMQGEDLLKTLQAFEEREYEGRMQLGADVLRHLEVFKTYKGDTQGTLYHSISRTLTAGGSRRLKQWLCFPLRNEKKINQRLDQVSYWLKEDLKLKQIRQHLRGIGDLERKLGKISNPSSHPRDLVALGMAFSEIGEILTQFPERSVELKKIKLWQQEIQKTLVDEIPAQFRDGGFIRQGVSGELDELIELATNSQSKVQELEAREKERTQIPSLKVRYNNVFGFYIEVTKLHSSKVPLDRYQRKQTLTNAERYTTDELNELEKKVITAKTRRTELELEIYNVLKRDLLGEMSTFLSVAQFCNDLDALTALSWLALENDYCRPILSEGTDLVLKASRHPVVEATVSFVANDIEIKKGETMLLTGPNMAGKSTIMRQVAITALMAQVGSFVPATSARVPIYDRIFTRIGASDFLSEGLSTFMVEMKETAEMLKESSGHSLVILDEVGRGTSTYDGMSLAQAILEFLLVNKEPMVLFATHYHELTRLSDSHERLKNAHMSIHEKGGELKFLYTLSEGSAEKSYGIQVARLAGLPAAVTKRAASLLAHMETQESGVMPASNVNQLDLFAMEQMGEAEEVDPKADVLFKEVQELSIQSLTPLEALNKIAQWQQELS